MAARGWVDRAPNPENRREVHLRLTAAGQQVLAQVLQAAEARYRAILDHIPSGKQAQVLESLHLLTAATGRSVCGSWAVFPSR